MSTEICTRFLLATHGHAQTSGAIEFVIQQEWAPDTRALRSRQEPVNIRQKIVIALMCVSLPALMALGGFGYWRAHSSIELSRTLSLEAIAASRVARLDNLLRDWQENLRTVAADQLLTETSLPWF